MLKRNSRFSCFLQAVFCFGSFSSTDRRRRPVPCDRSVRRFGPGRIWLRSAGHAIRRATAALPQAPLFRAGGPGFRRGVIGLAAWRLLVGSVSQCFGGNIGTHQAPLGAPYGEGVVWDEGSGTAVGANLLHPCVDACAVFEPNLCGVASFAP